MIITLLEHFDFGDGTLADLSDQEFEELIRSDEDFKSKFNENIDDAHIVALFREARRRALRELATTQPATLK